MMIRKVLLTAVAAAIAAATAFASTEEPDSLAIPGYEELDELVIEAERPVIQSDGAKTTYNVDDDPAAASSTALDILKKVPMVSVDGDGNVRLNGQSNFKFQLNGLDNPMLQQYAGQIMQSMPASAIVKIEVITEPGAKEDAEGNAGIINIITEQNAKGSSDGYRGSLSARVSQRDVGASANATVKKDKVTMAANLNYQQSFASQKSAQESTVEYLAPNSGILRSRTGQHSKFSYLGGFLNLSWEPGENDLFTFGANFMYLNGALSSIDGTTTMTDASGAPLWSYAQQGNGSMRMLNVSANGAYRHNFAPTGNYLVISYLFNFGRTYLDLLQNNMDFINYTPQYGSEGRRSTNYNRGHTVQVDYANDFQSEHHLLEVGAKGIFRRNSALASYTGGASEETLMPLDDRDSNLDQPQDIYAAYGSYTGKFGQLTALAGLRYEHTRMGIRDILGPERSFIHHLHDWVPNAALTWNFSPVKTLRAAYQMRISRPSIDQVNPFELALSPYEVRTGNPDLTSERSHKVSLTYSAFGRLFGGNIGLEYTRTDNAISGYHYLLERDGMNIFVTTYANIGKTDNYALTGFLNWNIIHNMNLTLNGRLAFADLKAPDEGYANHGWTGNIGGAWNYSVAEVYKFSAYGGWFARQLQVQGYSSSFHYYGISASRDLLASRALTIGISANNFFENTMCYRSMTTTREAVYSTLGKNRPAWNVSLSLTWNFGTLNAQVKKTGAEIDNDDINTSSNKGSGSSF